MLALVSNWRSIYKTNEILRLKDIKQKEIDCYEDDWVKHAGYLLQRRQNSHTFPISLKYN